MEKELTLEQAQEFVKTRDGYGSTRLYGIIADGDFAGQTVAIKSTYHLERYTYSRIYTKSTTITDIVGKA